MTFGAARDFAVHRLDQLVDPDRERNPAQEAHEMDQRVVPMPLGDEVEMRFEVLGDLAEDRKPHGHDDQDRGLGASAR